jgi:hypothetical protein
MIGSTGLSIPGAPASECPVSRKICTPSHIAMHIAYCLLDWPLICSTKSRENVEKYPILAVDGPCVQPFAIPLMKPNSRSARSRIVSIC